MSIGKFKKYLFIYSATYLILFTFEKEPNDKLISKKLDEATKSKVLVPEIKNLNNYTRKELYEQLCRGEKVCFFICSRFDFISDLLFY